MKRFVLCPADHHPHQTFVACPLHYHFLLQRTYFQSEVFEQCTVGPLSLRDRLVQLAKQDLPTCLQSLINADGTLPYAYILPKPSKAFEKARPIISYMLSWNAKLGQLIGTLVYELCRSIFGDMQLDRTVHFFFCCIAELAIKPCRSSRSKLRGEFGIPNTCKTGNKNTTKQQTPPNPKHNTKQKTGKCLECETRGEKRVKRPKRPNALICRTPGGSIRYPLSSSLGMMLISHSIVSIPASPSRFAI